LLPAALLQCSEKGLTSDEVKERLERFGPNKLPEESRSKILVFLG
jgi:magnesium-transporting ATPase (P-type)